MSPNAVSVGVSDETPAGDLEAGTAPVGAGKFALSAHDETLGPAKPLQLKFKGVKFSIETGKLQAKIAGVQETRKQILFGLDGVVGSGEVLAIIGPSGAGKTSLLDILVGKVKGGAKGVALEGEVTVNGIAMTTEFFKRSCSYCPQDDRLWSALTVRENLAFAARLYCPTLAPDQRAVRVENVIKDLGLVGCAETKVGNPFIKGISGGQKRRTSIGVELVAGRRCLFLDEPTSGLDAAAASQIMALLKELASVRNIAIVCSIHQPSTQVFQGFDKVMLLTMGRTAFFGKAADALPHFARLGRKCVGNYNPADFLLEITNSDFSDAAVVSALVDAWAPSELGRGLAAAVEGPGLARQDSMPPRRPWGVAVRAFFVQLSTLAARVALNYRRDPAAYIIRAFLYLFMSLFLGSVYYRVENTQADVYNRVFVILWIQAFNSYATSASLPVFSIERDVVLKEFRNGEYNIALYCLSNAFVQVPFMLATTFLATTPAYWITNMNPEASRFFEFYVIMFGLLYAMESLGVLIGTAVKDPILGLSAFSTTVSCFFVFNGQFVSVEAIPNFWIWMYYISPFRYAWEAIAKIVFAGQTFAGMDSCETCYGTTGAEVLDSLSTGGTNLNNVKWGAWFAILVLWSVVARLLHYWCLHKMV